MNIITWQILGWLWAIIGLVAGFYCIRFSLRDYAASKRAAEERKFQLWLAAFELARNQRFLEEMGIQPYLAGRQARCECGGDLGASQAHVPWCPIRRAEAKLVRQAKMVAHIWPEGWCEHCPIQGHCVVCGSNHSETSIPPISSRVQIPKELEL